ncbi:MAG TPA: hypothetical protein VD997_10405 [Phycisphaerales bacterium]|nr:hypothetical protein [Phycisphaerales bacterium]
MRILPRTIPEQIQFFETRLPDWSLDPAGLGLSSETVAQLEELTAQARAAYQAAELVRAQAKAATLALHTAMAQLLKPGAAAITTIKAKAVTMNDPTINSRARIDAPKDPSPVPAPHAPTTPTASIDGTGSVRLAWRGTGPTGTNNGPGARGGAGTTFIIYRQDPGAAGPRIVGMTSELHYTDETAPLVPGAPVLYTLQAMRAGKASPMTMPIAIDLPVRPHAAHQLNTPAAPPAFDENARRRAA